MTCGEFISRSISTIEKCGDTSKVQLAYAGCRIMSEILNSREVDNRFYINPEKDIVVFTHTQHQFDIISSEYAVESTLYLCTMNDMYKFIKE